VVELPEARQSSEGDVELPAGPLADLTRDPQHFQYFPTDRYCMIARRVIQALDVAALAPDTHEVVEAIELRKYL
jgi:hypothetical protein